MTYPENYWKYGSSSEVRKGKNIQCVRGTTFSLKKAFPSVKILNMKKNISIVNTEKLETQQKPKTEEKLFKKFSRKKLGKQDFPHDSKEFMNQSQKLLEI